MDSSDDIRPTGHRARKFPGYTLAELKAFPSTPAIAEEIAARESGASVAFRIPTVS